MENKGYLLLENGRLFEGKTFGAKKDAMAELVFTTAMTGYLETLTDPSYSGQMVVQCFPLIGNYGVIPQDFESGRPALSAYIVREWCKTPSNFRSQGDLDGYLRETGIPGLWDVDTRALTRIIRESGVMNAALMQEKPEDMEQILEKLRALPFHPRVRDVSRKTAEESGADKPLHVVLWDFGAKESIRRELEERGCHVTLVPCDTKAEEILAMKPDGVMLSNGPGDPADNAEIIAQIQKLCEKKLPMFGIDLGHHLLALSQGAKTVKMKYGHRGENQPAKDVFTGRCYITSQNHGFAVDGKTLPPHLRLRFINANDGTCEGIDYDKLPAFSVQFHPEACGGPLDTRFLFDRFIELMNGGKR